MSDLRKTCEQALEALSDMKNGWKYIRATHGDLYGVGWDRAQGNAENAITALRAALMKPNVKAKRLQIGDTTND